MADRERPPAGADGQGFLRRWSQRKAEARKAEDTPATDRASLPDTEPKPIDPKDLPDIESLGPGSDFKVFLQEGVPQHLRTLALRKLWRIDPVLANLDGLLDYGEDFTDAGTVVANLKSAYEVGKGYLDRTADPKKEAGATGEGDPAAAPEPREEPQQSGDRVRTRQTTDPERIASDAGPDDNLPQPAAAARPASASNSDHTATKAPTRRAPTRRPRPLPRRG